MSPLKDLASAIEAKNETGIAENLKRIASQNADLKLPNNSILKLLITFKGDVVTPAFVETAAEWAKQEENRKLLTDKDIIDYFLELLERNEETLLVSAIRALGNICYENEDARKLIDTRGLTRVLSILEDDDKRKSNLLTVKVSGFLVNLLMDNEELQKAALNLKILDVVEVLFKKYVRSFNENQMLFAFLLTVVNHVIDFADDQCIPFTESLCSVVIELFKKSTMPEISVLCLEILHGQSEKDDVKLLLAKSGVCELVFQLIEKYKNQVNDEESRAVLKMACDMIVIILTGDECMNLLYDNGQGTVYRNMVTWLDYEDPDLLSTGVLALGNFARRDTHCVQMVQNGISKKLICLLKKHNSNDSEIKVQHALLSTLKNLAIPQQNKPIVLAEGVIDVIYPMINLEQHVVIFKLLGTFRMVIDGQEKAALELITRQDFLERLMFWCYTCDHSGVRGEIPRLLAWLIKHCHSFKPFRALIRVKDSVRCLVEMTSSNHALMQNESCEALTLLLIGCGVSEDSGHSNGVGNHDDEAELLFDLLVEAEVGKSLNFVVSKYGEKMNKGTVEGLLGLLEQLVNSKKVAGDLKSNKVDEALGKLNVSGGLVEKLKGVISQINALGI